MMEEKTCLTCEFEPEWSAYKFLTGREITYGFCQWTTKTYTPKGIFSIKQKIINMDGVFKNCPDWRPKQ